MKRFFLKAIPYLAALAVGVLIYLLAISTFKVHRDLLVNIAAAFIAIPLLYLFYESTKEFSHKRLNKEIFDYGKMQVDRVILSIINQTRKIIYSYKDKEMSYESIDDLFKLKLDDIVQQVVDNTYLGFQIYKNWEASEGELNEILRNPYVLGKFEDEHVISLIQIIRSIRRLEAVQKTDELYINVKSATDEYIIKGGLEFNPENAKYPNRRVLLKKLENGKYVVFDFGDIPQYDLEKCLNYYKINTKLSRLYSASILELVNDLGKWITKTGNEFLIDTKMFRLKKRNLS